MIAIQFAAILTMLADLHPDVASVVWRFNRWHHHVDYKPFKNNELILAGDKQEGVNNYGMKLEVEDNAKAQK